MLARRHRLPAAEIPTVLKQGRKITLPQVLLIFRQTQNPVSRFAFVVPTKVDKRATVRNRLKRLLREAVQHLLPQIEAGRDILIIVKKDFSNLTQIEVERLVKNILFQSGGLRG